MKDLNLIEQICKCAEYGSKKAIISGNESITYQVLYNRSKHIAEVLISTIKNKNNSSCDGSYYFNIVALLFDHDFNIIPSILASVISNQVYIPLDPKSPKDWNEYILKDAAAEIIITNSVNIEYAHKLKKLNPIINIINIDELPDTIKSDNSNEYIENGPCYILYTSGSSGKPKGVIQSIANINNLINEYLKVFSINSKDNVCLTTSYYHTVSVLDIFSTLFAGGTICMFDIKNDFSMDEFGNWLREQNISIIHTVPTFFRYLTATHSNVGVFDTINLVILGGENLFASDLELFKANFSPESYLVNLYGSTELIVATYNILDRNSIVDKTVIPIGKTFNTVETKIIDEELNVKEVLQEGELLLSSKNLAFGYCNQPSLTESVFLDMPLFRNKVFRSGDYGKINLEGDIEYLGRRDNQIKIDGNRIELSFIEMSINGIEGVQQAVVNYHFSKDVNKNILASYIILSDQNINEHSIKKILGEKLPSYMLPAFYIFMDEFPKLQSGKINRKGMPDPHDWIRKQYLEPSTQTEITIAEGWKTIFKIKKIGIHTSFFELGGNSLLAISLVNFYLREFNIKFSVSDIFNSPTIARQIEILEAELHNLTSLDKILSEIEDSD